MLAVLLACAGFGLAWAVATEHDTNGKPVGEILAEAFQRLLP